MEIFHLQTITIITLVLLEHSLQNQTEKQTNNQTLDVHQKEEIRGKIQEMILESDSILIGPIHINKLRASTEKCLPFFVKRNKIFWREVKFWNTRMLKFLREIIIIKHSMIYLLICEFPEFINLKCFLL